MLRLSRAMAAVLVATALCAGQAWGASCCGTSSGPSLIVPKLDRGRLDLTLAWEAFDGFWNKEGERTPDPPGADLNQYRATLAYAHRLSPFWQLYGSLPYVWNDNEYSGESSHTHGLGDGTVGAWWEAYSGQLFLGPSLLLPTGESPYDDVDSSFDVTGRGFYRLDLNLLVEHTVNAWDLSLQSSYGYHFERPVNREFGTPVDPYDKQLGNRWTLGGSVSHTWPTASGRWTATGGVDYLREYEGKIDGRNDQSSGMEKTSLRAMAAWATPDRLFTVKLGWTGAVRDDDWGENCPITDIYSLGVSHAIR